jgi:hydrogenase small subunit
MAFAAIGKDAVREFDVLWITSGWGCDGDTIAMTGPPPSSEDVLTWASSLGQVPWIPKINLHTPFLALAIGDDFLRPFHDAAEGVRIPQEKYAAQARRV